MIYSPIHFWIVNNFNKCIDHIDIISSDRAWCGGCWQHLCMIRTAIELYHCWKFWRWWKVLAHELRVKSLLSFAVRTSWGQWVPCLQLCTCDSRAFDFCWHCSELLVADEELSFVPNRWPLSDKKWDRIRRPMRIGSMSRSFDLQCECASLDEGIDVFAPIGFEDCGSKLLLGHFKNSSHNRVCLWILYCCWFWFDSIA